MSRVVSVAANAVSNRIAPQARKNLPSISVVGLGYVGAVSVACLARLGHCVVGVDVASQKVREIAQGRSPIVESRLEELLSQGVVLGRISATSDIQEAIVSTEVTFLSVGTPTSVDGGCDLSQVRSASQAIGRAIAEKPGFHIIVLRCSVPPGTTLDVVGPEITAASGKHLGRDFGLVFNPEFLREGVAVADFFSPPKTVIGASDDRTQAIVSEIFRPIDPRIIATSIEVAEMVKYVDNVWHATKVVFGNEVGRLCKGYAIDSHAVMDIFLKDTKLNLSPYYLRPGFAFGGSCLPKEVRAVAHLAHERRIDLPLINSLLTSNGRHVDHAKSLLAPFANQRLGFLGLTFKASTDDLRESPTLDLMAELADAGWSVAAYDPNVRPDAKLDAKLNAARYARPELSDFLEYLPSCLSNSAAALLGECDVVIVSHATDEYRGALADRPAGVQVLDLVRLYDDCTAQPGYQGVAW